jgi:DNA helicase-2/ATP-dependent DNA helicase PcrA
VVTPRALMSGIDRAKNKGIRSDEYQGTDYLTDLVARVYPEYQKRLRAANGVDFGDLIVETVRLARSGDSAGELGSRFDHVLVDEFQDTNRVQYDLVRHLSARTGNLCVVGDDDQSIYGWRGADVANILNFPDENPGCAVVKLEQNYRSTQTILDAANGVIARNHGRLSKRLFTESGPGEPILYYTASDERREADFVAAAVKRLTAGGELTYGDCAIFYRTHAQSRVIEESFRSADLPYVVVGGTRFYDRAEVKDLLAYLRVLANRDDEVSLDRIVNVPSRGIGDTTIERVRDIARSSSVSMWLAMRLAVEPQTDALGAGAKRKLGGFIELIEEIDERAASLQLGLAEIAEAVLERSGYLERLAIEGSKESQDRIGNLQELVGSIKDFEREAEERGGERAKLVDYLERVSLQSSADAQTGGAVALMTVHAAKGLEFPVVFVTGLEEGTFPRVDPDDDPEELEEERRLAYVALTRARDRLFLTNAARRRLFGRENRVPTATTPLLDPIDSWSQRESRFIADVPEACIARPVQARRPMTLRERVTERRPERRVAIEERGDGIWVEREEEPPAGRPRSDGPRIEYEAGEEPPLYRLGQRVRHVVFGVGEVRATTGTGRGLKLTVYFPSAGTRTLVARFVQPA